MSRSETRDDSGRADVAIGSNDLDRRTFMLSSMGALIGVGILGATKTAAQADSNATLRVGAARDIASFDPAVAVTSTVIAANLMIFERLYETSYADRETREMLAIGDPEKVSDTAYRIKFRTGSVFHDGQPMTAEDIVFSINRLVSEENGYFYRQFIPFIKTARVVAEDTIEIDLSYATDLLKDRLAVVAIVPKSLEGGDVEAFGATPIGSGPCRFVSAVSNDRVVLERFDGYTGDHPALVETVEFRIITDSSGRTAALNTGEVSLIEEPADLDLDSLNANEETETKLEPGFLASFVMFNCAKPPFDDKRVRQALMYAIDREELVNIALFGNGKIAETLLPAHHPLYQEPENAYAYDPDKARALLAEAGFADGLKIDGRSFTVQTYQSVWNEAAANLIVSKWRDIGFDVAQNVGGEAIYSGIVDASFDVAIAITDQSWFGWDGPLLYEWFHGAFWSGQLNHYDGEAATRMQQLLKDCLQAGADQQALLVEVQAIIFDEMPMSLLFHRDIPTAWRPGDVDGVEPLQTAAVDVRTVTVT